MINKLYKLKQTQLDQQLMQKQQLVSKIFDIDNSIENIQMSLSSVGVEKFGAIGDFKILAIHKNSMKYEKHKLEQEKNIIENEIFKYDKIIIEYQKEVEKYKYLVKEALKEKIKEEQKQEELIASEFVLSKYANKMVG
ncbi:MAG: hypothetical protein KAJ49_02205 [Arcobacteraceae bacterium]|nr:hypothetical protein [Arcobacteraceae bacterium]